MHRLSVAMPLALAALVCLLPTLLPALDAHTRSPLVAADSPAPASLRRYRMLHSLSASSPFTPRGTLSLHFGDSDSDASSRRGGKAIQFEGEQRVDRAALGQLTRTGGMYRVKFVPEGETEEQAIVTSVPACALVASHFHENFNFHADPYGTLVSVTSRTPITACPSAGEIDSILSSGGSTASLQPKGRVSFGRPGEKAKTHIRPGFDAAAQAQAQAVGADAPPPQAEAPKNADGSPAQPPQTFWQKYWIYIVPLGIFMVIQAVMAPPEDGGQGGQGRK